MLFSDAQTRLATKLDIDLANISLNGLFSLTDLKGYLDDAGREAWDYHFWDVAEDSKNSVLVSGDIVNGYVPHPPTLVPSSIFLFKVDGIEYKKRNFQDYLATFQRSSASTEKVWAEYKRLVFFNKNLASVGTVLEAWGKKMYVPLSADSDLMPFSPDVDADSLSGNQAIILLAYAKALSSEKKRNPQQALAEEQKARNILDAMWKQAQEGRSAEQSSNRPLFDVPDFFRGTVGRGTNPAGTFNWS